MDKQTLLFTAAEQTLTKTAGSDNCAANTVSYIEAQFTLGDNWTGFDSIRAVWKSQYYTISAVVDANGKCSVPAEVMYYKSKVYVNLVGSTVDGDVVTDRLTTYPLLAFTVDAETEVDGQEGAEITPSQFDQFVAQVEGYADAASDAADEAEASAASIEASAEQIETNKDDIAQLKEDLGVILESVESVNLWNGDYTDNSIIGADGSISTNTSYVYTDYFRVNEGRYICFTRKASATSRMVDTNTSAAFYDAEKNFISRATGYAKLVPANAVYARNNLLKAYITSAYQPMIEYCNSDATGFSPTYQGYFESYYQELSTDFRDKKICTFGDSLAAADGGSRDTVTWIDLVKDYFGAEVAYNRGIGGSCVTANTSDGTPRTGYAYVNASGDAGEIRGIYETQRTFADYPTEIAPWMETTERVNTIPTDTDVLIVLAGSNDVSTTTQELFRVAYKSMVDKIIARVPNAKVYICTLPYHQSYDSQMATIYNAYRTIIREIAEEYGFPCIELRKEMGVNAVNYATYMTDAVHYNNATGRKRTAECIIAKLKGYSKLV